MLKNHYDAIFFDLDGTLLPMDMDAFTKGYFVKLHKKMKDFAISLEDFTKAIWTGTYAMMKNDGTHTNAEVFWKVFSDLTGLDPEKVEPICNGFYGNEFNEAIEYTLPNPLAKEAVAIAHEKASKVVLSTNPIFPEVGQKSRLSWLGLSYDDFDLVTSYENERFCKPNPQYFISIMERLGLTKDQILIVGNDEKEDCNCAKNAGIDCYLVTDTMIASKDYPWDGPKGTFSELMEVLAGLS